ncbi:N-acetylglucosamine-6-phosphate deacetylase [Paenibacillus abyssi]|uniref:N-acetylglucosamine-6-phosphate deacetylase n=1 Tax=Paenibacillus abyssi TaxID=1340531 RepID=A0A917G3H0_9BACL|nr:N-acetylglucosamine-6-phosphate deacetylase [Paenibacillus abyssi]GGG20802.1 N-acetylglucosamine-6-phosphate deacetylase [Paenibacillus abyssi]
MIQPSSWRINNVNIVSEDRVIEGTVTVENGLITALEAGHPVTNEANAEDIPTYDGQGGYLLPGFIDMHAHGGFGSDFMDAEHNAYDTITRFHAQHGTTGMLATTMTAPQEDIEAVLACVAEYQSKQMPYAALLGVHLEGPFISPKWPGAQNPAYIVTPQKDWIQSWNRRWPALIRQLTLAPESEGALEMIAWLKENGIIAAAGHTDADYDTVKQAAAHGLTQAVHTYNAMTPLHHRHPGTVGAVLTIDSICAELIADGHHVHPAAIQLLARAKPEHQLVLITDAMSAAGLGDGDYQLGGLEVTVSKGIARLQEGGNLAGSTLTMIGAVRYMRDNTDLSISQISRLASSNPAKRLGIWDRTGSIQAGKQADLVWTDEDLNIQQTWVKGRQIMN